MQNRQRKVREVCGKVKKINEIQTCAADENGEKVQENKRKRKERRKVSERYMNRAKTLEEEHEKKNNWT